MFIQVHTDNHIQGREALTEHVEAEVARVLARYESRITDIEVHLGDVNADRPGDTDKRCLIEARLAARDPVAASHNGAGLDEALKGAVHKLRRRLDSTLGRAESTKGGETIRKRNGRIPAEDGE
jgi:hypothetical protein